MNLFKIKTVVLCASVLMSSTFMFAMNPDEQGNNNNNNAQSKMIAIERYVRQDEEGEVAEDNDDVLSISFKSSNQGDIDNVDNDNDSTSEGDNSDTDYYDAMPMPAPAPHLQPVQFQIYVRVDDEEGEVAEDNDDVRSISFSGSNHGDNQ